MPGWNLREGILTELKVSDDEFWSLFNYVFSDACKKTNTYKFGLIKSICDQIYDVHDDGNGFFLSYEKIFSKFAENYWNLHFTALNGRNSVFERPLYGAKRPHGNY